MTDLSQFKANALAHGEVIHLFHSEVLFMKGMPVTSIYIISKGSDHNFFQVMVAGWSAGPGRIKF
jgi:hypothetical protein